MSASATKKSLLGLVLGIGGLGGVGCTTAPATADQAPAYVPYSERTMTAAEHWYHRDLEDQIERQIERRNAPR